MIAIPKPPRQLVDHCARKRERDKLAQTFRDKVWRRAAHHCERCERPVLRTIEALPNQGHVHHKRGRNVAPADRYNPAAAQLLCRLCHEGIHSGRLRR